MTTESEAKLARYGAIEKEADTFGRVIGVRRLKPSEQTRIAGLTSDLTGSDEIIGEDGVTVKIPHRLPLLIAAAVCMIDEARIPFPRTRGELDSMYDRLDAEGLGAASRAMAKLSADEVENPIAEAKN